MGARVLNRLRTRYILNKFHDAINDLSLALKYYRDDNALALIPGDNSEDVLNRLSLEHGPSDQRSVVFLRGAHHGAHYGR